MTEIEAVRFTVDGPVARVELYRPASLNAQTPRMWDRLREIGRELRGDVRCVVVTGAGPSFSAGLDRAVLAGGLAKELVAMPGEEGDARIGEFQEAFSWLRRPDLLSVAVVRGHAIGAGLQLALACDFRVLSVDAKLRMPEVSLGLVPDLGGTKRLVELVGYGRALELCLTSRAVGAGEATAMGLATLAVEDAELEGTAEDLVAALLSAPRSAAIEAKALLLGAVTASPAEQLAAERAAQLRLLAELTGEARS
ncbi:enoyl-CoA hydratase/isomerase family protein [Phytomonospora endophytica]|uniref:Enoyl-CoA hydratase/carnithine racemase n=1 Tax=Phytomonospora endophytica TaxID=714109 RepID=A0A841FDJ6_9ACTN|nr:enoyl-CoA hydratase/isomerase family protein [Phytomonospora endophytica]MBB6033884.1 enoyl-CoA hydratase/carnithine racemase [Phytomonospora endophytica]GIG64596.1 enoyl-CoA hydratase [Phytomonospora endophytica]